EDPVRLRIERGGGLVDREIAVHRSLGNQPELGGDALPFRYLGRRLDALELFAKRASVDVVGESGLAPRRAPRRQIAGELVEATLNIGPRQVFDPLPRRLLDPRSAEDDEAGAAGDRWARSVGSGERRSHPALLQLGRQAALELADVPRAGDVEREVAARELVPDVRHI